MVFLEINEFSPALLNQAALELKTDNIRKLLQMQRSETEAIEKEERFGLDPWVQWVSIHTGLPATTHKVDHLGDVPQLNHKQIWESISEMGFNVGVWGAMNASKGSAKNCDFFFPDPWTFSERAYPPELNQLLGIARYYSKNYLDLSYFQLLKEALRLSAFCLRPKIMSALIPIAPTVMIHLIKYGPREYLLFLLFDLVNATLFRKYYKASRSDFAIVFLNSIAHLQHHKWTSESRLSEEMTIGFRLLDKILGIIFSAVPESLPIVAINSFSQVCAFEKREFLYRQKNPSKFLELVGIKFLRLEQAMTNDGHVFFSNETERNSAAKLLNDITVGGQKAFHVDTNILTPLQLFFQFVLWEQIDPNAQLVANSKQFNFFELFEEVARRSGTHIPNGDIFARGIVLPKKMWNYEIGSKVVDYFLRRKAANL